MSVKRSKNKGYGKSFYLSIIKHIISTGKLPECGLSKQALSYHVKKLVSDEVIKKIGYATYKASIEKFEQKQQEKEVKIKGGGSIRGHGYHWKLKYPDHISLEVVKDRLEKKKVNIKEIPKSKGFLFVVRGYKVFCYGSCMVIYNPKDKSFYEKTANGAFKVALEDILGLIKDISELIKRDLSESGKYWLTISKQHYAKLHDGLASYANKRGEKIVCKLNGKAWLLVDRSLKVDELETVDRISSITDMDHIIVPFMNDLKSHADNTGECLTMGGLLKICSQQQHNIQNLQQQILDISLQLNKNNKVDYIG